MLNHNEDKELLARKLKRIREQKNVNKRQLGLKIGVHPQNIGKYERCEAVPSALILKDIAEILEVTTDTLLKDNGYEQHVVDIKDTELLNKIKSIDKMEEEDRQFAKRMLDLVILKNSVKNLKDI